MKLIPIKERADQNERFLDNPECSETFGMTIDFYKRIGYNPPWICYYAELNGVLVGSAGFKGKPVNNTIEISYGTFENHRQKGVGAMICRALVELALKNDPHVRITARTLLEKNYSTRILEKNNFHFNGSVIDPEDGEVWEWVL